MRGFRFGGVLAVVVVISAVALWLVLDRESPISVSRPEVGAPPGQRPAGSEASGAQPAVAGAAPEARPPAPPLEDLGAAGAAAELDGQEEFGSWEEVDLEVVRAAMPDNLYWKLSSPTQDAKIAAERAAQRVQWNVEYGKVLSGTATEEEIRAYYDHRARLSGDYIEFATYVLDHYQETLPERDVGLLMLARRLHQARLEEIPRRIEEAFQRKREQDAAREAWRKDQEKFGDVGGAAER